MNTLINTKKQPLTTQLVVNYTQLVVKAELFTNPRAQALGNDQRVNGQAVCTQAVCTSPWKPARRG
jgi:hypothetical protein